MSITNNYLKRTMVIALVAALAFTGAPAFAQTTTTQAQQIAALQAQIAALMAQLNALSGATTTAAFTRDLTIGASGADVTRLQQWLISRGYSIPAGATGYFGVQTQAAVAAYQRANAITPAVGYFGPITRAKVNASLSVTPTNPTTPTTPDDDDDDNDGELEGGAGSVDSYELISNLNNEEVGEDEEDAEVAGLEIEVDDGSDIEITAVRLDFDTVSATNDDFSDFASEVSLWLDGEEVARVDADEFDEDNDFSRSISLDDGAIIRAGDMGELVVAISGVSNLDSADEGDSWSVDFDQVRFMDADGATITDDPNTAARTFTFEEFASAAGIEITIDDGDNDDINESRVITVDATDDTEDVELLAFTMEVEGDSDITIDSLPIEFTVTGASDLEDMVSSVYLSVDGDEIGNENSTNGDNTIVFDDLDFTIDAGEEVEFIVTADFNSLADALDEGDTIEVTFGETETDSADFDAEDESGEDVNDADISGSATGGPFTVFETGIMVEFVSAEEEVSFSADDVGEADQGTFEITFDVTAMESDLRIDRSCTEDQVNAAGQGVEYSITNSGSNTTVCSLTSSSSDSEDTANTFELDEDDTRRFTLTVVATATADHFAQVELESINWGTATDDTNANYYTFDLDEFQTGNVFLNTF
ncbi:MAG TPA: peptidoglycan-binding protein [Candidatus Paceibacterota bacterium]|nr:peptidoglycan-binding protein [Candidatus Paceibacterota bacterium]